MYKSLSRSRLPTAALALLAVATTATAALAHHPMGGATPTTFWQGFLSGLGHPVIGIDHLAFVLAAGIACAFLSSRLLVPALFIAATIAGCLLTAGLGVTLPAAEFIIAGSVIAVGAIAMLDKPANPAVIAAVFAVAGLFHGGAYAEAVVGSEA